MGDIFWHSVLGPAKYWSFLDLREKRKWIGSQLSVLHLVSDHDEFMSSKAQVAALGFNIVIVPLLPVKMGHRY